MYLFTSFITSSGSSYLTPMSTIPVSVFIPCLLHISTSQFAPFLPTASTTLSAYTLSNGYSSSSIYFASLILTPFISPFSTIKSPTVVPKSISTPLSSIYFSNLSYTSWLFSVPKCLIGIFINLIPSFSALLDILAISS